MDAPHLIGTLLAALVQTVGIRGATEQPRYQVVETVGAAEVRRYDGRIAAETIVAGEEMKARNEGFRLVAGYIFGANTTAQDIAMTAPVTQAAAGTTVAMTAPVAQQSAPGGWSIQFVMPAQYTLETLPRPKDPRVRLVQTPPRTYAVVGFTGSRSAKAMAAQQARLTAALAGSGWRPVSAPQGWFYDPPWTLPFTRRNEVAVEVER